MSKVRDIKTNVTDLYSEYNTLSVDKLFHMNILLFMYKLKYMNKSLPQCFDNFVTLNADTHLYSTRRSEDFHVYRCNSNIGSRCLSYLGSKLWNSLDTATKNCASVTEFKKTVYIKTQNEQ